MKYDLVLKGGMVVDPLNHIEEVLDVGIIDGKIEKIGEIGDNQGKKVLYVNDNLILPGLVDSHVHVIKDGTGKAGYRMLVRAGVTTAFDFRGPIDAFEEEIIPYGQGLNVAVLNCIFNGREMSRYDVPREEIYKEVRDSLEKGAIGIKIMGGHAPLTPKTTKNVIEITNEEGGYIAFHAGTSKHGSNIEGMEEAVHLANGLPLHIAHINSYCRGMIEHPLGEAKRALTLLKNSPNIVCESYLAPFNGTNGELNEEGLPKSHVTRNCLKKLGYPVGKEGIKKALLNHCAAVYTKVGEENQLIWGEEGYNLWEEKGSKVNMSFLVNSPVVAAACAAEKDDKGYFVVNALSTDGGAIPRNFTLKYGLSLVAFGALTLKEFAWKSSYAPAQLIGLKDKGHFSKGADADIVVVDLHKKEAKMTIINGKVCMMDGELTHEPGKILTTEKGESYLKENHVPYEVIDLERSVYRNGKDYLYRRGE